MEVIVDRLEQIMSEGTLEIRADGRAGSGVVLAMQSIAGLATNDPTLHAQEWPFFSSARKGAPTRGFLRLSRRPIEKASEVTKPHVAILMDEGVTAFIDFAQGVPPGNIFVLNTPMTPPMAAKHYRLSGRIYTIDGNGIAMDYLKKPLGNISIFALLTEILPGLDPGHAKAELAKILEKRRLPKPLVEANCNLFEASLGHVAWVDAKEAGPLDHVAVPFTGYGELGPGGQSRLRLSRTNLTSAYARTGFVLKFADPDRLCNGCSHCITNCPENIIEFVPDTEMGVRVTGAQISKYCKLCSECIAVCPKNLFTESPVAADAGMVDG